MYLWVTTSYVGWHWYENAPDHVRYLRNPHRHTFGVKVVFEVDDNADRVLEFHMVKEIIHDVIETTMVLGQDYNLGSCEVQAKHLFELINKECEGLRSVTVDEDGECGATYIRSIRD